MSQKDKRLARAKANPKGLRFEELLQLYQDWGFVVEPSGRGSHYKAQLPGTPVRTRVLTRSNPVKGIYVRQAVEAIEEAQALS